MRELNDRVVIITGASSGIGRALALELARRGATLGLIARRKEALEEVASCARDAGADAAIGIADVADRSAVEGAIAQLVDALGPVHMMIANAGIDGTSSARNLDVDRVEQVLQINLLGALYSIGAVLPAMVARGSGRIVAVSSLAAWRGLPRSGGYCASKAGLTALMESFRIDLRGTGVGVTTIHPGFIRTPMTANSPFPMPFLMDVEPAARAMIRGILSGRSEVNPPWRLATLMRIVRHFPNWIHDRVVGGR